MLTNKNLSACNLFQKVIQEKEGGPLRKKEYAEVEINVSVGKQKFNELKWMNSIPLIKEVSVNLVVIVKSQIEQWCCCSWKWVCAFSVQWKSFACSKAWISFCIKGNRKTERRNRDKDARNNFFITGSKVILFLDNQSQNIIEHCLRSGERWGKSKCGAKCRLVWLVAPLLLLQNGQNGKTVQAKLLLKFRGG